MGQLGKTSRAESPLGTFYKMTGETVSFKKPENRWFESTLPTIGKAYSIEFFNLCLTYRR